MSLILIIDDDDDIRSLLADILGVAGYETAQAQNGQHALELLRNGLRPALMVLDMRMPVMDGGEFLTAMTKDPYFRNIPVVVTTASGRVGPPDAVKAVFDKPFDPEILVREIGRFAPLAFQTEKRSAN